MQNILKENAPVISDRAALPAVQLLATVPEEEIWLAGQLSRHTRRAYEQDVAQFIACMGIRSGEELRQVSRAAVVAW